MARNQGKEMQIAVSEAGRYYLSAPVDDLRNEVGVTEQCHGIEEQVSDFFW